MNELLVRINFLIASLPRAEKAFAQALLENPDAITHLTLAEIAAETGSSDASIIRFCKRMSYHGYSDLKRAFIAVIAEGSETHEEEIEESDGMDEIMRKVFQSNVQTMQNTMVLANEGYKDALNAIINAKSIHFFGVGDAYAACQFAFMKFCRLGMPSSAYSDVMLQFTAADNLGPEDVALAVSYEGRSKNIVQAMKIARMRGATTISITKMNKSPLLKYTDISLFISVSDLTIGRDKATRRIADQFILDVLYLGYITKTKQDYTKRLKRTQAAIDCNKII